jgi:hypothetical protein
MNLAATADHPGQIGVRAEDSLWSPALLPWLWVGVLALTAQVLLVEIVGRAAPSFPALPGLLFASHLLLIPFLLRNMRYLGVRLMLLGLALNLIVMAANGGMMPVTANGVDAVGRQQASDLTAGAPIEGTKNVYSENPRFSELSDAIVLPIPGALTRVVSVGDVLIAFGTIGALASVSMRAIRPAGATKVLSPVEVR